MAENYYHNLSLADTGSDNGILSWVFYVLKGLKDEIDKVDRLANYDYLKSEILLPTIKEALSLKYITETESIILSKVAEKQIIQASDIKEFFPNKSNPEISRQIKMLIEKKMLVPEEPGKRKYLLCFNNNYLLRVIYKVLDQKGFLSVR